MAQPEFPQIWTNNMAIVHQERFEALSSGRAAWFFGYAYWGKVLLLHWRLPNPFVVLKNISP